MVNYKLTKNWIINTILTQSWLEYIIITSSVDLLSTYVTMFTFSSSNVKAVLIQTGILIIQWFFLRSFLNIHNLLDAATYLSHSLILIISCSILDSLQLISKYLNVSTLYGYYLYTLKFLYFMYIVFYLTYINFISLKSFLKFMSRY